MSGEPPAAGAAPPTENAPPVGRIYRLSAAGRRVALILLLGVAAVWIFALWTLVTQAQDGLSGPEWVTAALMLSILVVAPVVGWNLLEERSVTIITDPAGLTYRSVSGIALTYAWPEVAGVGEEPPTPARWARLFMDDSVSETTPLTTEPSPPAGRMAAETTQGNQDNNHSTASPTVTGDEPAATPLAPAEAEDQDQAAYEATQRTIPVRVVPPAPERIGNPLVRALWQQAHGATLPVPGELENRDDLLATIRAHQSPADSPPPA